jgi:hypothetical protein
LSYPGSIDSTGLLNFSLESNAL